MPLITHVEVDDQAVLELLPRYIANRLGELEQIIVLAQADDFYQICEIGHRMAGSGGAYYLPQLSVFGQQIEESAIKHDTVSILACARDASAMLESVKIVDNCSKY